MALVVYTLILLIMKVMLSGLPSWSKSIKSIEGVTILLSSFYTRHALTNLLVDAIDPLDVTSHDVNGSLFRAHLFVEQMIRLW